MKFKIYLVIILITFQSCKKDSAKIIYNVDEKPREIIAHGNEKYIKDKNALELFEMGLSNIEYKDYEKAKEYFLKANEIEKNNIVILNCLALVESSMGNNQKSIEMLYKNISIDSSQINTYTNLGQNLMSEKKYIEANEILLLGLKKSIDPNLHQKSGLLLNLAISFKNLRQCDEALKYANEALAISQNNEFTNFANQIIVESKKCK
jgi:tetratricopeptide (TPR) repeat protein